MKLTMHEKVKEDRQYPYFGKWEHGRIVWIVLFTEPETGTLVYVTEDSSHKLGCVSEKWGERDFTPFYGTITVEED